MSQFPRVEYLKDIDILFIELGDAAIEKTVDGGDVWRNVDLDVNGAIVSVEFVNASRGINLRGLPREIEDLVRASGHGFPVLV
ncbi:MAG TPA: DUF2283 domain-containing protein [Dehalococcoidia bacterium]|nr:DUF2283 domain-containing protein [Dehalococcoidia bacterium]